MSALNPLLMNADDLARYYEPRDENEAHLLSTLRDRLADMKQEADDYTAGVEEENTTLQGELDRLLGILERRNNQIDSLHEKNKQLLKIITNLKKDIAKAEALA